MLIECCCFCGILITLQKEQPSHYQSHIHAVAPIFVSSSLVVPPDIGPKFFFHHYIAIKSVEVV